MIPLVRVVWFRVIWFRVSKLVDAVTYATFGFGPRTRMIQKTCDVDVSAVVLW